MIKKIHLLVVLSILLSLSLIVLGSKYKATKDELNKLTFKLDTIQSETDALIQELLNKDITLDEKEKKVEKYIDLARLNVESLEASYKLIDEKDKEISKSNELAISQKNDIEKLNKEVQDKDLKIKEITQMSVQKDEIIESLNYKISEQNKVIQQLESKIDKINTTNKIELESKQMIIDKLNEENLELQNKVKTLEEVINGNDINQ